ncbi:MAG: hypothetical protein AD742_05840 [Methylibium sp. NZG]|nr:MAG: hypothetical protein AD742_05840 [Methylibium sp. NZG]
MAFEFFCSSCGETHHGMPAFGAEAPLDYYLVPPEERPARVRFGADDCVIDGTKFFVLGCIELAVHGEREPFTWGVWVSLGEASYRQWLATYADEKRAHVGPFFGWLSVELKPYADTMNLKTNVHLRDHGARPIIALEPTDHPLAVEQRDGISVQRVAELFSRMVHEA